MKQYGDSNMVSLPTTITTTTHTLGLPSSSKSPHCKEMHEGKTTIKDLADVADNSPMADSPTSTTNVKSKNEKTLNTTWQLIM
jgi:hypothetical protein